jgi:tRNA (mo5U34)-methyltransferase
MADPNAVVEKRRFNPVREGLEQTGLYHSFRLPDGTLLKGANPLEHQLERLASFRLPEDLHGRRALDIGPWDGFFTFELERRGAAMTAIDYVDLDTFRALHRAFGSSARYEQMDVYELDAARLGTFDVVLCLGVLYHLKHPLLALEKICAVTTDVCIVDTFVTDGEQWRQGLASPIPSIEFYEREELAGQFDNWCGPTVSAVEALARAAGFARTEVLRAGGNYATVAAHRRWSALPPDEAPPVEVAGICSHSHRGRSFRSSKEEYVLLWCDWQDERPPSLEAIFPEIDGCGAPPLFCARHGEALQVGTRLPPGLAPGRHRARLKIGRSRWSKELEFVVDLPDVPSDLIQLASVQDGVTWRMGEVDWRNDGWATAWVTGLSAEADPGNTVVEVSGIPHRPETADVQSGQVNFRLRPLIGAGEHELRVLHRGAASQPLRVTVSGSPPPIRGLEQLPR